MQVLRMGTEEQVPYRMGVHPRGDGVLCAFPNGCRLLSSRIKFVLLYHLLPVFMLLLRMVPPVPAGGGIGWL